MLVLRQPGGASGAPSRPCLAPPGCPVHPVGAGQPRGSGSAAGHCRPQAAPWEIAGSSAAPGPDQPPGPHQPLPVPTSLPGRTDGANGGAREEQGAGSSQQKGPAMVGETVWSDQTPPPPPPKIQVKGSWVLRAGA